MSTPLFAIAGPIAESQLGLATCRQLLTAGATRAAIDSARRAGRLRAVEQGVYLLPGAPLTADVRLLARVLASGPGAVASHHTAAWLWGLQDHVPPRHEVSVPRGRRPRHRHLVVHESTDLDLVVPGTVRGIPVTDVGRTILDCAGRADVDVELMVDAARRGHQISDTLLPWVVARHARSGRRGIEALRSHVELDELPHSDFERLFGRWLRAEGVVGWVLHHRVVVPGFGPVEFDIAWPETMVALELEGADHRDRRKVHDRDTERQSRAVLAGWDVLRVTYRRWLRHSDQVLCEIRAATAAP